MSKTKIIKLKNGLDVILSRDSSKHYTYANLSVKIGQTSTNYIKDGKKMNIESGIPHFIEHYIIEKSKFGDFSILMNYNFVESNGITSLKNTDYYINTVHDFNDYLEKLIIVVNDAFISDDNINSIKTPILKEIDRKEDSIKNGNILNYHKAQINTCENVFPLNCLGNKEFINNLKSKDIKDIYNTFYQPSNEKLVIIGNFKEKEVLNIINKTFEKINRKYEKFSILEYEEKPNIIKEYEIIEDSNKSDDELFVIYKVCNKNLTNIEKKKFFTYFNYLKHNNFGESTKLFNKLFDEKKIKCSFNLECIYDLSSNYFIVTVNSITSFHVEITKCIEDTINNLQFDEESFETFKNNLIIKMADEYNSAIYKANSLLKNIEFNIYEPDDINYTKNLNLEELKCILEKINFKNKTILEVKKSLEK